MPRILEKSCSRCPGPAELSIVSVLSSIGHSPRRQATAGSVAFCSACFEQLLSSQCWGTEELRASVNNALTQLKLEMTESAAQSDRSAESGTRRK
jgi:hypothetical protein